MDVVFLGAGASKAMGYPLTSELLPRIVAKLQSESLFGRLTDAERKRDRLKKALNALAPGWVHNRLPTFVDLLSLLDYCIHQNVTIFPSGGHFELRSFRAIIEAALVEVSSPDRSDRLLADTFRTRLKDHPSVAFATTNYDLACEVTLVSLLGEKASSSDFGFEWRDPFTGLLCVRSQTPTHCLYKLHGSTNWLRCPSCEQVYINLYSDIAFLDSDSDVNEYGDATTCHCGYSPLRRMIVSPSVLRLHPEPQFRQISIAALHTLMNSDRWFIVGFSLPTEDVALRSIFLRAAAGPGSPEIRVYQDSEEARPRYEALFSCCTYHTSGFEGFLADWSPREVACGAAAPVGVRH
jgi:hypothetical protein